MRRIALEFLIVSLVLLLNVALATKNETNKFKIFNKNHIKSNPIAKGERYKRAVNNVDERPFWASRGKKNIPDNLPNEKEINNKIIKELHYSDNDQPFWAIRGKRDSLAAEDYDEYIENSNDKQRSLCKDCLAPLPATSKNFKSYMEPYSPFWGNRGKRDSSEVIYGHVYDPLWDTRGRKQDKYIPSGNLGYIKEDTPFWGNRGRRDDEPFWGNRGRRDDEPFWGNRGRRQDTEPFWGSRGRRQNLDPFWGNRGRREDSDPFWGNRGRRKDSEPFWPNRNRRKELLKESILNELKYVENDIANLARLKRNNRIRLNSFWDSRGRNNKIKYLFNGSLWTNSPYIMNLPDMRFKTSDPGSVHDSRIYAEQPHYILTERNSRSSSEDDPYVISRGKKHYMDFTFKEARDRRGAIEEIVKSVRNDPYYIVRGKKHTNNAKRANINDGFTKAKELVCTAIDFITDSKQGNIAKREIVDKDDDRRTIFKKLAAQLQNDPYFVSRGKKNEESAVNEDLKHFIIDLANKCNN